MAEMAGRTDVRDWRLAGLPRGRGAVLTLAALLVGLGALAGPVASAATTVVVRSGDVDGSSWILVENNGGTGSFVEGPDTPPAGAGAFRMETPSTGSKVNLKTAVLAGTPLADIGGMSYATWRSSASVGATFQVPSVNMEIFTNLDGPGTGYATLVYEPIYSHGAAAIVDDTWQTWDTFDGGQAVWWTTRPIGVICATSCFVAWEDIVAAAPDGVLATYGVNQGSGNEGIVAATDALSITVSGRTTTFDLEPAPPEPTTRDDCKRGGWRDHARADGSPFKNQGDCIQYVNTGR